MGREKEPQGFDQASRRSELNTLAVHSALRRIERIRASQELSGLKKLHSRRAGAWRRGIAGDHRQMRAGCRRLSDLASAGVESRRPEPGNVPQRSLRVSWSRSHDLFRARISDLSLCKWTANYRIGARATLSPVRHDHGRRARCALLQYGTQPVLVRCEWSSPLEPGKLVPKSLAVPLMLEKGAPCMEMVVTGRELGDDAVISARRTAWQPVVSLRQPGDGTRHEKGLHGDGGKRHVRSHEDGLA